MIDPTNLSAIQYCESIQNQITDIFAPLKHIGIKNAGYLRGFKDGTYLMLSSNLAWAKYFLTQNLADKSDAFVERIRLNPFAELLPMVWPPSKGNDCLSALYDFNIWHGIDLTIKHKDFIEVYFFATDRENNQIYDLYINHLDLLIQFTTYFQEKAAYILDVKDKKILAKQSNNVSLSIEATSQSTPKPSINIETFVRDISGASYGLDKTNFVGSSSLSISSRQRECAKLLTKGYNTKQIARDLQISPRTVETHIATLLGKFNVNNRTQLIYMINKML